jgi:LPS-assembly protein
LGGGRLDVEIDGYGRLENGTFRIKGLPVLYIPYAVFPTRMHRTSGLLVPRLGSSDERGFIYSQPFYWAIDKHRDLTLTANIETAARAGLGVEYRYRNSRRSGGRFEALYFNDRVGGEPATNVISPQFSGAQVSASRGLLRLRHRQAIDPQTSFYADLFAVSDDVFLRDVLSDEVAGFAGRRLDRTRRYTVSRVGVAGGRGTWSYGLEDTYYQDLVGPDRFTLQRPLRLWSVVDHDLPGGFFYTLAGTADSFRRRHGVDGDRLATVLTLERPVRFGALETSLWTRGSLRAYRMADRNLLDEDGNFVARVQASPLRAVFEAGAELSSTLGRRWSGRESGPGSLEHRIKPFLRLRHRSGSSAGLPIFDGNDASNRRTVGSYGLVSELIGQGEEGPARELASLSVAQSYNFSQRVLADHFSDIDATLYVSPRPGVFVGGTLSYNVGSDVLTGANAQVGWARVLAPRVSTRPSKLEAAYRFVRGGALETIQGRLALALGHRTTVGFVGRYDVVSADFVERGSSLKIESDCGCWSVDFGFVSRANPDENQFRVLVELGGLGSLGTSILGAARPGLDRPGPAGGLWRPGW